MTQADTASVAFDDEQRGGTVSTYADVIRQRAINESYNAVHASDPDALGTQSALPSSYKVTDGYDSTWAARDQTPFNSCWAFGATASVESNILRQRGGTGASSLNLSEHQLAYFAEAPVTSSTTIAGRAIDADQAGEGSSAVNAMDAGGEFGEAAGALTSWEGLASESQDPSLAYRAADGTITAGSDWSLAESLRGASAAHVTDMEYLPSPATIGSDKSYTYNLSGTEAIKRALVSTGGVGAAIAMAPSYNTGGPYKAEAGALYNPSYAQANHAITIVGWDDDYASSNFATHPVTNGAFLVRNSYGSYGPSEKIDVCVYMNGHTASEKFTQRVYTDPSGADHYVYLDESNYFGHGEEAMFEITKDAGGTYSLDASKTYMTGVKLAGEGENYLEYQLSDGSRIKAMMTPLAGTENSPTREGYFWLSYYDASIVSPTSFVAEEADSSGKFSADHIYEYDYLGNASKTTTAEGAFDTSSGPTSETVAAQCANVFTAVGNEVLTAVSATTQSALSTVEVFVYRLVSGATGPTQSATGQPEATVTYKAANAGYHTIDLTTPFFLHAGESYSVVERITNYQGQGYVPVEMGTATTPGLGKGTSISKTAKSGAGESYISQDGGRTWTDVSTLSIDYLTKKISSGSSAPTSVGNVMIRAFTKDWTPTPEPTPAVTPTPSTEAATTSETTAASETAPKPSAMPSANVQTRTYANGVTATLVGSDESIDDLVVARRDDVPDGELAATPSQEMLSALGNRTLESDWDAYFTDGTTTGFGTLTLSLPASGDEAQVWQLHDGTVADGAGLAAAGAEAAREGLGGQLLLMRTGDLDVAATTDAAARPDGQVVASTRTLPGEFSVSSAKE
ncbi:MAG: lectin like domain-containing protein [Atopobiaceae bacterium]|jgi:C1A family cysteine protease|nr:lectin like domain-containing protein [Atopobiaceae bacterium]